jgi:hypothetical protein
MREALERIFAARPFLVGIQRPVTSWPVHDYTVLHAGPPPRWQRMCGPLRGAIVGALQYEGWAADETTALALIDAGTSPFGRVTVPAP